MEEAVKEDESVVLPSSILDEDLTGTDTSMPLLKAGLYQLKIEEVSSQENKAGTGDVLKIKLSLMEDGQSTTGEKLNKGFPLFSYISLVPTEEQPVERIKKSIALFQESVGQMGAMNPLSQWQGKTAYVRVKIAKATDEFPESNKVTFVKPPMR